MSGLYIHIPFCRRKCAYCDFVSFADHTHMRPYLAALRDELRLRAAQPCFSRFDTVFIGGGTPSLLPGEALADILHTVRACFSLSPDAEISVECNPGTLDADKLRAYRDAGVNRLSLGLQSASNALLKRIGRIHTWEDFCKTYADAQAAGFENINVDIMYGLPAQRAADHEETLRALGALSPAHVSAYSLILEEGTPLYAQAPVLPDEEETYAMHRQTIQTLRAMGYERYEISNYAKPGYACKHNLNYWDNGSYLGVGLNAHSAWRMDGRWTRFSNTADLPRYLDALQKGRLPVQEETAIGRQEEMFECVMLGLRKLEGVREADFFARFGMSLAAVYPAALTALRAQGWLVRDAAGIRLTDAGLDMQNRVLLYFMDPPFSSSS